MISPQEAARTLKDAGRTERHSAQLYGYRIASPHLILWGCIWLIGYAATDFYPRYANWIWIALIVLGCLGAAVLGSRAGGKSGNAFRIFGVVGMAIAFMIATYAIFSPIHNPYVPAAFPALLGGAIYTGIGLWMGARLALLGIAVMALTLGGFFYLTEHFLLWMAGVGGGGLILAGLWFRSA